MSSHDFEKFKFYLRKFSELGQEDEFWRILQGRLEGVGKNAPKKKRLEALKRMCKVWRPATKERLFKILDETYTELLSLTEKQDELRRKLAVYLVCFRSRRREEIFWDVVRKYTDLHDTKEFCEIIERLRLADLPKLLSELEGRYKILLEEERKKESLRKSIGKVIEKLRRLGFDVSIDLSSLSSWRLEKLYENISEFPSFCENVKEKTKERLKAYLKLLINNERTLDEIVYEEEIRDLEVELFRTLRRIPPTQGTCTGINIKVEEIRPFYRKTLYVDASVIGAIAEKRTCPLGIPLWDFSLRLLLDGNFEIYTARFTFDQLSGMQNPIKRNAVLLLKEIWEIKPNLNFVSVGAPLPGENEDMYHLRCARKVNADMIVCYDKWFLNKYRVVTPELLLGYPIDKASCLKICKKRT